MRQVTAELQPTALDGFIATPSTEQFALFTTLARIAVARRPLMQHSDMQHPDMQHPEFDERPTR
jgi:hypothetical protein